ncbi:MAG TPA: NAD(P)/FAD-dependent oxidoreductase [Planctomycetota bacterium]|nr:NAD(P)/FAD-dependent oxidoreductase [Planctomycetota bacterium]
MQSYDVIIIGAGMSGLAAGIRLAYYGKRVVIFDKHTMPGGLNSFYTLGGRKFDVGLHAMTNYVPRDVRHAPLNKLLRQLRLKYEDFDLSPQIKSDIRFPGVKLTFTNRFEDFETDICEKFPGEADNFRKLVAHIRAFNDVDLSLKPESARKVVGEFLKDELLIDMLFCPLMFYGSANVDDMEFGQFVIMFKSIFCEGFARPREGVRRVISTLIRKYKENKGDLRMGEGVKSLRVESGRVAGVELDNGSVVTAPVVLSSAGRVETEKLCSDVSKESVAGIEEHSGQLTFVESISVLDCQPRTIGYDQTITFFNNAPRFRYRPSEEMLDPTSAVVCVPNNFQYAQPLEEGMVRLTNISNFARWRHLSESEYQARKKEWYERSIAEAVKLVPDFRQHVKFIDTFTPRTIRKFTSHENGAVYGSPNKLRDGRTRLSNLFLIGTDQGFLGIVGALLSGISIANLHVLRGSSFA